MTERGRRQRSRPQKEPLSLEAFTAAALAVLEREGVRAITLRRLARELETGPASLYAYVRTVQELHALVLDRALESVNLYPELTGRPRERLEAVLNSYLATLLRSPGLGELAAGVLPYGDNTLKLTDTLLGCLRDMGLSPARAAWGYDLLALHLTAKAAELDRRRTQQDPVGRAEKAYAQADAQQYPHLAALRSELFSGTGPGRVSWAIESLLAGVATGPEPEV